MARTNQRPKLTAEQRAQARKRTDLLWKAIERERENYQGSIAQIAADHGKSEKWVAMQLFSGGKIFAAHRKANLYNAVVHDLAKKHRAAGRPSNGRRTLKELAQEASEMDYNRLSEAEKERLLAQLEEDRGDPPVEKVPAKTAPHTIDLLFRGVQPELEGGAQRTGMHYALFMMKGQVTDNWTTRTAATPEVVEAFIHLFKCTPEEMAMKVEAFLGAGLSGIARVSGKKRSTALKSDIRTKVSEGLRAILTEKGIPEDEQPSSMKWANYEALVCKYGVELRGWTEPGIGICNPGQLQYIAQLERLHAALEGPEPTCHWAILTEDEWEARKAAQHALILSRGPAATAAAADAGSTGGTVPAGPSQASEEVSNSSE